MQGRAFVGSGREGIRLASVAQLDFCQQSDWSFVWRIFQGYEFNAPGEVAYQRMTQSVFVIEQGIGQVVC